MGRVEVFKNTSEDWYPSYKLDGGRSSLVEVVLTQTGPSPPFEGLWRVCVWGADDCGMEKDFDMEAEAWVCFIQVICLEDVTRASLRSLGFIRAYSERNCDEHSPQGHLQEARYPTDR